MKKNLLLTISIGLSLSNIAQTTINGSDINPTVGESFIDNNCSYVSPGSAGASQTWDLSSLTSSGTTTTNVNSSTTNGANVVYDNGSGNLAYYNINASAQELVEVYGNSTTITYSNSEKILQFPLSYNANYSDTFRATFLSGGTYPAVRSGSNTLTVDGYGTLMLPGQTISDVIRVNLQQTYADTIDIGSPYIINYTTDIYIWYKAGSHFALASMTNANYGGQPSQYGLYTGATNVSVNKITGLEEVKILGNPFNNQINFVVEANQTKEIEYSLVDLSGQVVYQTNSTTLVNGSNSLSINTTDLAKGMYALKITSGDSFISKIVVKE